MKIMLYFFIQRDEYLHKYEVETSITYQTVNIYVMSTLIYRFSCFRRMFIEVL
jgi:hypothetical protein